MLLFRSWTATLSRSYHHLRPITSRTKLQKFQAPHKCILNNSRQCNPLGSSPHVLWCPFTSSAPPEPRIKVKVRGIQKDVFPLTTKRVVRRKKPVGSEAIDKEVFDVVAYAPAEELNLESLKESLILQGLYTPCKLPDDVVDTLHLEAKYRVDDEQREIFFFRDGAAVFWNMPLVERTAVLEFLAKYQRDSYDRHLILEEFERVEFTFTETGNTRLVGDEIQLQKPIDSEAQLHHQLEKYAFSNAIALSVKLAIWEASLERYVDSIEWVLQDLKDGKKVRIPRADVLRKTGELFTLRHLINLSSDLLDTPDFYWDREKLEHLYNKTYSHLAIARRTKVMNEKLTHCCELADLLNTHLNDKHHTRLEWMIILLIMVEVLFEIVHMAERYV